MLISTVKLTESKLSAEEKADLRVLTISIDPERDTPEKLLETMQRYSVEADRHISLISLSRTINNTAHKGNFIRKASAIFFYFLAKLINNTTNTPTITLPINTPRMSDDMLLIILFDYI